MKDDYMENGSFPGEDYFEHLGFDKGIRRIDGKRNNPDG